MRITRRYELDAGHRVPFHGGKCRNLHGHRYVVHATIEGAVIEDGPDVEAGMVLDFGTLKAAMVNALEPFDHKLLLWKGDPWLEPLSSVVDQPSAIVVCPSMPTAERLAEWWAALIAAQLPEQWVRLVELLVHETPNCSATWTPA